MNGLNKWLVLSVSTMALIAPISVQAQTVSSSLPAPVEPEAAAPSENGGDIVVTAQRRKQSIQSVPISIQAISSSTLEDRGVRSPQDLAQFTPNVAISSPMGAGGQPNITIRGVGLNDFNTNNAGPNGVYVDEFYISAPSAQGSSLFDIQQIEVLKGPQGTLYGRNTSGGAINIVTAAPTNSLEGHVRGSYSSFNTVDLEGAISGPLTSTLSGRISGVYGYSRGYMYNAYRDTYQNGTNNYGIRSQLLWQPDSRWKIALKGQFTHLKALPTAYKFYGTLDPATGGVCSPQATLAGQCVDLFGYSGRGGYYETDSNRDEKTELKDAMGTMRIDYDAGGVNITSLTGYDYNSRYFPDNTDANPYRSIEINFGSKSWEFTQELRLTQQRDHYNWVAGIYYLNEIIKQNQPLFLLLDLDQLLGSGGGDGIAAIQSSSNRQLTQSAAAFGQFEWEALHNLRLIAGGRFTWEKKRFSTTSYQQYQSGGMDQFGPIEDFVTTDDSINGSRFNFRIAANYTFTPGVMVYANIATGYKAGGFNGGFLANDATLRALQLRPIKPETVTSYEIGLKSTFLDRRVTLNLSGFYNDYRNQQVSVLVPNPNPNQPSFFALDNAAKARTFGLDADITVRPTDRLTFGAQLGLLDTKLLSFLATRDVNQPDYSGNRLAQAPATSLTLSADYAAPVGPGNLELHYDSNYRGKQYFEPSNSPYTEQPGYWIHNARISYHLQNGMEIGAFARNFTRTKYAVFMSNLTDPFGSLQTVVGTPRSFGVDVKVPFGTSQ